MSGILHRLALRMATRMIQGLPRATLDYCLLFVSHSNESKDGASHRRPNLPSYSWAGWRNRIHYPSFNVTYEGPEQGYVHLADWLKEKTWIEWYEIDHSGVPTLLWNPEIEQAATNTIDHLRYSPKQSNCFLRFKSFATGFTTKPTFDRGCVNRRNYPLLDFWTMVVYLIIKPSQNTHYLNAADYFGAYGSNDDLVSLVEMKYNTDVVRHNPIEFLVLSECSKSDLSNALHWARVDPSHQDSSEVEWNLYWVMAVCNVDGVMERIGLGQIYQHALSNSFPPGPLWKEFILG